MKNSSAIADINISLDSQEFVLGDVELGVASNKIGGYVSITNTESMYHALRLPGHLRFINSADHSLCDGVGVIAAGYFGDCGFLGTTDQFFNWIVASVARRKAGGTSFMVAKKAWPISWPKSSSRPTRTCKW